MKRKLLALLATIAVAVVLGGALAVPSPAQADSYDELWTCWYAYDGIGPHNGGGLSGSGYAWGPMRQVPGSPYTGCEDINVGLDGEAWSFRVRFYPSGGGNYTNGWTDICGLCRATIATNVLDGTWYRIEGRKTPSEWGDKKFDHWV